VVRFEIPLRPRHERLSWKRGRRARLGVYSLLFEPLRHNRYPPSRPYNAPPVVPFERIENPQCNRLAGL